MIPCDGRKSQGGEILSPPHYYLNRGPLSGAPTFPLIFSTVGGLLRCGLLEFGGFDSEGSDLTGSIIGGSALRGLLLLAFSVSFSASASGFASASAASLSPSPGVFSPSGEAAAPSPLAGPAFVFGAA